MDRVKRKYRGAEFGVNIGTSVAPQTFYEIESLASEFRITKAEVVRRLVLRGLAEYHRDGRLPRGMEVRVDEQSPQLQILSSHDNVTSL